MNPPKAFWAAIVLALIIGSSALLISQMDNLFGKATDGGTHITGTIVLTDRAGTDAMAFVVSLPGTTCDVKFLACIINASLTFETTVVGATLTETSYDKCEILSGNIPSGVYEYRIKGTPSSGSSQIYYSAVAYSCTA